jgi:hypothetical protein
MKETNVTPIATANNASVKVSLATGLSLCLPCLVSSACRMS